MWDAVAEGKVSEVQVLQTLDEMLFANLDVTIGGLSWNFVFLAASPADQSRLRAEILSANKEGSLEQPLAAFSVPQSSRSTVVLDGFVIPEGTDFIVDTHALNIRGKLWSPDNLEFRPERFSQLKPTDLRYAFWRFGFGPRQCLGRHIADLIIRHTVVQIVQRFELAILDDKAWERDKAVWISCPDFELSCRGLDVGDSEERDATLAMCDTHRAVCPGQV
ncbi:Cytochrome P450 like protein [Zymoseptoria brevis]|uniref:Cytochrome P450 like protein n=1 Tax=Zymoseptoria brevis TaxID=1047168 RepID=A0A0F4GFF8_9PEZI|nr:Cytochrome P450 like protein [Zymoseptoria brevis]